MSHYLLAISIGPVQEFIAAARRTRDLWFGSHVLSEVSKAAAKALYDAGATLIFPAPTQPRLLAPNSELLVANHILALTQAEDQNLLSTLVEEVRRVAQTRWLQFAKAALDAAGSTAVNKQIWDEQVNDVLDFYAAWVPLGVDYVASDKHDAYQAARNRVDQLLAGRKVLRNFIPSCGHAQVPKSSLDAARESVFTKAVNTEINWNLRLRLGIKRHEQLDAVGLTKRCAPIDNQNSEFVSVVRVAADPWIRGQLSTSNGQQKLEKIKKLCHPHFAARLVSPVYQQFPFDGEVLLPSRLAVFAKDPDLRDHAEAIRQIQRLLQNEQGKYSDIPSPYFAILLADGDRMGAALERMSTPEQHRTFSQRLSAFAQAARQVIEAHQGCLVYSGGDDVLAFLPLDLCLPAAWKLHEVFRQHLQPVTTGNAKPTLSVGIAIGHCLEPLEDLLQQARAAEKDAKTGRRGDLSDDRDGLAVHFATRGNDALCVRAQWISRLDLRLERWINFLNSGWLSSRAAYDIYDLAQVYRQWPAESLSCDLLVQDLRRTLARKRAGGSALTGGVIAALSEGLNSAQDLERLAFELLIARHMAQAYKQAGQSAKAGDDHEHQ